MTHIGGQRERTEPKRAYRDAGKSCLGTPSGIGFEPSLLDLIGIEALLHHRARCWADAEPCCCFAGSSPARPVGIKQELKHDQAKTFVLDLAMALCTFEIAIPEGDRAISEHSSSIDSIKRRC